MATLQEHLNNVFGVRLRITRLRAVGGGPGIEFLEYFAPRNGRAIPTDERANDLARWQTKLIVGNATSAAQNLLAQKTSFVASGVVVVGEKGLGFTQRFSGA